MEPGVLLDQLLRLLVRPPLRDDHFHDQVLIPAPGPHAGQANPRPAGCAGGYLHGHALAVDRRHFDLPAQHRLRDADRDVDEDILAFAAEVRVRVHADADDDVLPVFPLTGDAQLLPVLEPGRDLDVDLPVADAQPDRPAQRRGLERDARFHLQCLCWRLWPRSASTSRTCSAGERAEQVFKSAGPPAWPAPAAEHPAKDLLGHFRVHLLPTRAAGTELKPAREAAAGRALGHFGPELVVHGLLLRVAQGVIRVLNLLEPGLGLLVPRVAIWVVLAGELLVRLRDFLGCRGLRQAQDFVVVTRHGFGIQTWGQTSRSVRP